MEVSISSPAKSIFVQGSRKSASQGIPVFCFTLSAIRCMLCGGPVETIASAGLFFNHVVKNFTEGLIQNFLASGIKKFPRIHTEIFSGRETTFFSFRKA